MGTNFYLDRPDKPWLHIGKRSAGNVFYLHVRDPKGEREYDHDVPAGLAGWWVLWTSRGAEIVDDNRERLTPDQMARIVTESPESARRHPDGKYCLGHMPGYDLVVGSFS